MASEANPLTLEEFLDTNPSSARGDDAWYSETGDCIFFFLSGEDYVADRLNNVITLYRGLENRSHLVGFQIKGIKALARHMQLLEEEFSLGRVNIGALLYVSFSSPLAYSSKPPSALRRIIDALRNRPPTPKAHLSIYRDLMDGAGDRTVRMSREATLV